MKKRILTISREFGSGGHSIGQAVADRLGIAFYDQNLIERIAKDTEFAPEFIKESDEAATTKSSLLFNFALNRSLHSRNEPSASDTIFFAQRKVIEDIAENESCVIVGRCSDYILRDRADCLHAFIHADYAYRAARILEHYGEREKPIDKRIADKDTRRRIYYEHYTERVWGLAHNYHVTLDTGALGEKVCIETLLFLFQH